MQMKTFFDLILDLLFFFPDCQGSCYAKLLHKPKNILTSYLNFCLNELFAQSKAIVRSVHTKKENQATPCMISMEK